LGGRWGTTIGDDQEVTKTDQEDAKKRCREAADSRPSAVTNRKRCDVKKDADILGLGLDSQSGAMHHRIHERDVVDIWMNATAGLHSQEDEAARKIQIAAIPRLIANRTALKRVALVERLELEMDLQRGLRLLLLCLALFCVVIYSSVLENESSNRIGLLQTFQRVFQLDNVCICMLIRYTIHDGDQFVKLNCA